MNAVTPKGWCPTLFAPMASGDGLLVRVKPRGAILRGPSARALAVAARQYGNGVIELTNRASIQVRGLSADTVPRFAAAMVAAGLGNPDPAVERRRCIIAPPLSGDDPGMHPGAAAVTHAVEHVLTSDKRLAALPAKFGVAVDAGGKLAGVHSDITIRLLPGSAIILPDGSDLVAACDPAAAAPAVARLATAFLQLAAARHTPPRRMRALVAEIGAGTLFAAAGLSPVDAPPPLAVPIAVGWLPYPGTSRGAFGAGLPFGATDADGLVALADHAENHGDGTLRVTPWRTFAIPGVTDPRAVHRAVTALGLIADADDPRAGIAACPGSPSCASATVATRADAARLAQLGFTGLHVSGCAKGCAHPAPAAVTLVGTGGHYDMVCHGRAGDPPVLRGLPLATVVAALRAKRMARA